MKENLKSFKNGSIILVALFVTRSIFRLTQNVG